MVLVLCVFIVVWMVLKFFDLFCVIIILYFGGVWSKCCFVLIFIYLGNFLFILSFFIESNFWLLKLGILGSVIFGNVKLNFFGKLIFVGFYVNRLFLYCVSVLMNVRELFRSLFVLVDFFVSVDFVILFIFINVFI